MKDDNEWNGGKDGFPPVGTECEGKHNSTSNGWFKCVINGYQGDKVWFEEHLDTSVRDFVYPTNVVDFRPAQTERDKFAVEVVSSFAPLPASYKETSMIAEVARRMYDEGYRRPMSRIAAIYNIQRLVRTLDTAQAMAIADMLGHED